MPLLKPMLCPTGCFDINGPYPFLFPVYCQPKIDGICCIIQMNSVPSTRTLHHIPNKYIRQKLIDAKLDRGLHGDIVTYTDGVLDEYNTVESKVMSAEGEPDFKFIIYDICLQQTPYYTRLENLKTVVAFKLPTYCTIVRTNMLYAREDLLNSWIDIPYTSEHKEGLIIRNTHGYYKQGRATTKENLIHRCKYYLDDVATVIGVTQMMHNSNRFGSVPGGRSKAKAGMVPIPYVGSLIVKWTKHLDKPSFEIGTFDGVSQATRNKWWLEREALMGKRLIFRYYNVGMVDRPRSPVFKSWITV